MHAHKLALAIVVLSAATAGAATITNGGFEQPGTFVGNQQAVNAATAPTLLPGWTVMDFSGGIGSGSTVELINGTWEHASGSYSLDLEGVFGPSSISQTIADLLIGVSYTVTFALAGNPASTDPPNDDGIRELRVSAAGASQDYSFDTSGAVYNGFSFVNMGWIDQTFTFTAQATSETLVFLSLEGTGFGPALDDIRISETTAVPLPASLLLLISGMVALGALGRPFAGNR